ncbi:MAG: TetR/AcrR family transcriptional regulator [Kineosporiaceae bacterium]
MPRHREDRIDESVLPLALESFLDRGVDGTIVVDIARRARVSRQSIYRRWPTREALVLAALDTAPATLPEPRGTTLRDRLISLLSSIDIGRVASRFAAFAARAPAESQRYPEVARRAVERLVGPRHAQLVAELRAGAARGELDADIDVLLLADVLTSPPMFRMLVPPITDGAQDRVPVDVPALVDLVLRGAAPG